MENLKISIVIPVYKSSESLVQIALQLDDLRKEKSYDLDVVFVNDSPFCRETCNVLKDLNDSKNFIKVLTLRKNMGQHLALLVGLKYASGDYVVTMDDDLQHPVSEIPKLVEALCRDDSIDAVFAVPRYRDKKHALWRNVGSFVLNKIDIWFLKKPNGLVKSAFKIMRKEIAENLVSHYNAMPSISSLIINETQNIININVKHDERRFGKGNYSLAQLLNLTANNIVHYSSLPLRFLGFSGIITFLVSALFVCIVFVKRVFLGISIPGYASTVLLIAFFGGMNLLGVGIIGEYLIRIIKEQQKPMLDELIRSYNG